VTKLVWRVKLVAGVRPSVVTGTEVGWIERDEGAGLADLGLKLAEMKQFAAALQAEIVPVQVSVLGERRRFWIERRSDAGCPQRKWRHGRWAGCRRKLAGLYRWTKRQHMPEVARINRLQRHLTDLLAYLEPNQDTLVHYAARRRCGEPVSTAFAESAVNEIVAKRMNKKQQMRWNRATVQPFFDVRCAVLNDTLEDTFRHCYPGFRSAYDDQVLSKAG
jgi:hypothetical protein